MGHVLPQLCSAPSHHKVGLEIGNILFGATEDPIWFGLARQGIQETSQQRRHCFETQVTKFSDATAPRWDL
jgi:hypothetical protein